MLKEHTGNALIGRVGKPLYSTVGKVWITADCNWAYTAVPRAVASGANRNPTRSLPLLAADCARRVRLNMQRSCLLSQHQFAVLRFALELITNSENRSISSICGLHCNNIKSTPASSNSLTRSPTCSPVPTSPDLNPRFDTE